MDKKTGETRIMVEVITELDRKRLYAVRDANEVWWRFMWEANPEISGWYAWKKTASAPRWVCLGTLSEEKILQIINVQPPPITLDDQIDFHLWLQEYYGKKEDNSNGNTTDSEAEAST